jgi:hypothetical protein
MGNALAPLKRLQEQPDARINVTAIHDLIVVDDWLQTEEIEPADVDAFAKDTPSSDIEAWLSLLVQYMYGVIVPVNQQSTVQQHATLILTNVLAIDPQGEWTRQCIDKHNLLPILYTLILEQAIEHGGVNTPEKAQFLASLLQLLINATSEASREEKESNTPHVLHTRTAHCAYLLHFLTPPPPPPLDPQDTSTKAALELKDTSHLVGGWGEK